MTERTLDRAERLTLAALVVYLSTLAVAVVIGEPVGWLVWGVAMVALVGTVMALVNRSTRVENE